MKVKATKNFNDLAGKVQRVIGDEWDVDQERYTVLVKAGVAEAAEEEQAEDEAVEEEQAEDEAVEEEQAEDEAVEEEQIGDEVPAEPEAKAPKKDAEKPKKPAKKK